jgi:putative transposase
MMIHQAFKFRLYPNTVQRQALARQFGCSRFVYNTFLQERMDFYAAHKGEKKQGLNYYDTALRLTAMKRQPEYAWLGEVNSQALQVALRNLDTAYRNFFAGRGEFPKFKSRRAKNRLASHSTSRSMQSRGASPSRS